MSSLFTKYVFLLSIFRCDNNNNNSASVVTLGLRSKEQSTVESRSLKSGSRVYVLSNEVRGFLVVSAIAGLSRSVVVLVMGSRWSKWPIPRPNRPLVPLPSPPASLLAPSTSPRARPCLPNGRPYLRPFALCAPRRRPSSPSSRRRDRRRFGHGGLGRRLCSFSVVSRPTETLF